MTTICYDPEATYDQIYLVSDGKPIYSDGSILAIVDIMSETAYWFEYPEKWMLEEIKKKVFINDEYELLMKALKTMKTPPDSIIDFPVAILSDNSPFEAAHTYIYTVTTGTSKNWEGKTLYLSQPHPYGRGYLLGVYHRGKLICVHKANPVLKKEAEEMIYSALQRAQKCISGNQLIKAK
ncbi:MAG: hypothetical protein N3A54_04055 [Patescibacteria group bacterium]|nr:hypothetical protein [Patescibacteria group bacterium]